MLSAAIVRVPLFFCCNGSRDMHVDGGDCPAPFYVILLLGHVTTTRGDHMTSRDQPARGGTLCIVPCVSLGEGRPGSPTSGALRAAGTSPPKEAVIPR